MDNFGTGYSSLGNLRSFSFDKININLSFINDLGRNAYSSSIVRAALGLGQSLGIATCAKAVETKDQLMQLRGEGCMEVQGFYYGDPIPNSGIPELLRNGLSVPVGEIAFVD